jgi:hypothetical protein
MDDLTTIPHRDFFAVPVSMTSTFERLLADSKQTSPNRSWLDTTTEFDEPSLGFAQAGLDADGSEVGRVRAALYFDGLLVLGGHYPPEICSPIVGLETPTLLAQSLSRSMCR